MNAGADSRYVHGAVQPSPDPAVWYALRPEVRSHPLSLADLKLLATQQQLRRDDLIWHPAWDTWRFAHELPGLFDSSGHIAPAASVAQAHGTPAGEGRTDTRITKQNLKDRARHELRSYVVITVYIWMILSLLRLHETLLADSYHVGLQAHGLAIVNALILGKVVLIAEALRVGDRTAQRAPAFAILIRSIFFALAIVLFHVTEHVVSELWHGAALNADLLMVDAANARRSLIMAAITTIALMPYFLIKEIERRTGEADLLLMAVGLKR
ncbi:MAG: DUF4339 domain-containing protein [Hyphomicrobium sp.]|nr:DUF4339 domain-containing protein [Hyphomicrobium sp.]